MLARTITRHATGRLAKRVPALKFLVLGEVAMLARRHLSRLTPDERRRLASLLGQSARRQPLSAKERDELGQLASKLDGRAFAGGLADAFSPVPLPRRVREGRRRR